METISFHSNRLHIHLGFPTTMPTDHVMICYQKWQMRNAKRKGNGTWNGFWMFHIEETRRERENNTNGEEEHGDHIAWIQ